MFKLCFKKAIGLLLLVCLTLITSVVAFVEDVENCRIAQIRELIPVLEMSNQGQTTFDAFGHGNVLEMPVRVDPRHSRLDKLSYILAEAKSIVDTARGRTDDVPFVIVAYGAPWGDNDSFTVYFASEEYLELVDILIEFTGISQDILDVGVMSKFPSMGYVG